MDGQGTEARRVGVTKGEAVDDEGVGGCYGETTSAYNHMAAYGDL
jgi:hypothetical protein